MASKKSNSFDFHIGSRVRARRILLGMSQEKLGTALGVTFQQVQKYEKGTNRIGAGRLQSISSVLEVPPSYFFEEIVGLPKTIAFADDEVIDAASSVVSPAEGVHLTRAFARIRNTKTRRTIVDLVTALATAETG